MRFASGTKSMVLRRTPHLNAFHIAYSCLLQSFYSHLQPYTPLLAFEFSFYSHLQPYTPLLASEFYPLTPHCMPHGIPHHIPHRIPFAATLGWRPLFWPVSNIHKKEHAFK